MTFLSIVPRSLLGVATILFAVASCSAANYSGLCVTEGRYLDEEAFIIPARERAFQIQQGFAQTQPEADFIHYADLEEFSRLNPDCCSLSPTGRKGFQNTFLEKIRGDSRTFVRVHYRSKSTGGVSGQMNDIYFAVTNCGVIWDGIN
ncbi:hypothetical protein G6M04_30075 [Agrobacterium rhizogenes]|uniref:hypothetical protein n=1 Tax=Rhizobium rhizogenes TaxID=359 RepID=UPI00157214CA|nr:hypothetical protein [Rhizobium rhizogenes]NTG51652.1 hypothetical protein [Rhizobium rhizogenes]